jgi:hypothetical protein
VCKTDQEKQALSSLHTVVERILPRFQPNSASSPANRFVFGFVSPQEAVSVEVSPQSAQLMEGIRTAEYLIYAPYPLFEALLNPDTPNRAELVNQLEMRPDYPFNNYLLSIFLNAFDLEIPDLDYEPKRFDGPFPFPPRYPAAENPFRQRSYTPEPLPVYDPAQVPQLVADAHPDWVAMYNKAWQLAFTNLRQPEPESGFIASFIDPAFNANTYLWDSCFMTMFGRYARPRFRFMGTLDNFYAKQHDNGFICRELNTYSGKGVFESLDPRSTGPNILAWTEWTDYQHSHDQKRLHEVFPVLVAYHRWWKDWRTHPDGSYWTCGWGSGMDNQTRVPDSEYHHRHYAWVDATMQQALSCRTLLRMAQEIDRSEFNDELTSELLHLEQYVNMHMWDEAAGFYYDAAPDGTLSSTKSIAAYWGLLSGIVPEARAARLIDHLNNPTSFNRPHRIPTESYDSPGYNRYGGYWLGSVWSPTNYMVLRGLTENGYHALAHEIARNHVGNLATVFQNTGTLWENYAPESPAPGKPAGRDFVGWTGLSAISIPIEYLIGLRPVHEGAGLLWDIRLTERHGILRYPAGSNNFVDLVCEARHDQHQPPVVSISTKAPIEITMNYGAHGEPLKLAAGEHRLSLGYAG